MEIIMVVLAVVVAALLVGPAVAIGAIVDARRVRSQAALLRGRLETVSGELGGALWHLRETRNALVEKAEELQRQKAWARVADGCATEFGKRVNELKTEVAELKDEIAHLHAVLSQDGVKIEALSDEVASLRKQRRYLASQRDSLSLSVRGLTADAEGSSADAVALRSANNALMSERAQTFKRLGAANSRVRALEAFIDRAYGPVDECEIKDGDEVW